MKVVEMPTPSLMEIPQRLRRLADQFENGEQPNPRHVIVVSVSENGDIINYGFGEIGTTAHEVGTLFAAAMQLISK